MKVNRQIDLVLYCLAYFNVAIWRIFNLGNPGHGSRFIENTAAEKVQHLTNKLLGFREEQKKIYNSSPDMTLGDVTTVNLTYMSGGVQMNVVPNEFTIGFDIRITPTTKLEKFEAMIRKWIEEAGGKNICFRARTYIDRDSAYLLLFCHSPQFFPCVQIVITLFEKSIFFSKNSILTKPQYFHKFFLTIFLVKSKLSTA